MFLSLSLHWLPALLTDLRLMVEALSSKEIHETAGTTALGVTGAVDHLIHSDKTRRPHT